MKKFYTNEFWKLMKICAAQGFIAFMICGVVLAHDNDAQLLDREVTLDVQDVTFDEALKEIAQVSHAYFSYSPELLKVEGSVTIKAEKQTLRNVLNELLTPRSIRYTVDPDDVTISLKPVTDNKRQGTTRRNANSDERVQNTSTVTGIVKGGDDQPMPGVNVVASKLFTFSYNTMSR
jgi:TonB-dependent starch-binding outer membrane protein SusC